MTPKAPTTQQEQLAALYEVSSRLGTTLDLPELLNLVMDSIIQLTNAERGFIMLLDNYGEMKLVAGRNVSNENIAEDSMKISRSVVQRVIDSRKPTLTDNAQEDERFANNMSVVGYQLRSIMCAPLLARGRVIGAAFVDNRLITNAFNQSALDLLIAFTNQAAIAIENARLFQQTDQALARRVEELTLFQRIDRELNKSLDLQQVLRLALDWALRLTDADGGSIGLLEMVEEEQKLRLLVSEGRHNQQREQMLLPLTHPVLAQVLATGQEVCQSNVSAEASVDGTPSSAQLVVPIQQDGKCLGMITLESHLVTTFLDEDVAFVKRLADRASVAIKNASLYADIQAAHSARAQFISLVTHELRLPLTSIKGYADLLTKGLAGPMTNQQKELMAVIQRNTLRMNSLISDLSDINRLESGRMKFEKSTFDILPLVNDANADLKVSIDQKGQALALQLPAEPVLVLADRGRVGQIITNLLSNAHKYTPSGGEITIEVTTDGSFARLEVRDTGFGISEEDQEKLFNQFFRSENPAVREQTGWGLGLSVVKMMVENQGGEVFFSSKLGEGSTFGFTLPVGNSSQLVG